MKPLKPETKVKPSEPEKFHFGFTTGGASVCPERQNDLNNASIPARFRDARQESFAQRFPANHIGPGFA